LLDKFGYLARFSACANKSENEMPRAILIFKQVKIDLAYEAEVSRSYLSQLEKGVFYVSLKIIGRLSVALNAEPAELLKTPHKSKKG